MISNPIELIIALILIVLIGGFATYKKSLDAKGLLTGIVISLIILFFGGLNYFFLLMALFVVGDLATRYGRGKRNKDTEQRSSSNVIGNSLAAVLGLLTNNPVVFASGISTALGDTLSSEIGMLFGGKPRLITTLKQVEIGAEGAVSLVGLIVSVFGALLIGLLQMFLFNGSLIGVGIITLAGFLGGVADSFLGATLETKGMIDNTLTNFFACCIGVLLSLVFLTIFGMF